MPSLDEILKDTLVRLGGALNPAGLTEFEPGIEGLSPRPAPDPLKGPAPQPVWTWDYTGVREINQGMPMNRVENLEVWSRTVADMHGTDQGWMTVAMPVEWGPVVVTLPQERVSLPLTQKYFVKGYMLSSANYAGGNSWWPLPATMDQSFASVFVYDLTSRQPMQPPAPVDAAHYNSPTFMPDPNVDVGDVPVGGTGVTEDRHFICVVLSLVCMQERPDFEPGGIVGMGRFYPHFMIMSNKRMPAKGLFGAARQAVEGYQEWGRTLTDEVRAEYYGIGLMTIAGQSPLTGIDATVRVTRPDRSGYYGSFMNPGGAPRVMQHADMDPVILPLLITEPNEKRGIDPLNMLAVPYWDVMFDYIVPLDYRAGAPNLVGLNQMTRVVDRALAGQRRLKGVLRHLDYTKWTNLVASALSGAPAITLLPQPLQPLGAAAAAFALSRPSLQAAVFGRSPGLLPRFVDKSDFLPRIAHDVLKLAGQGTFDNLHMAPRMKMDQVIGTPQMNSPAWQPHQDTLDTVRMAPFCDHDCMHTHWRWGLAFEGGINPNQLPIKGFVASADARFAGTGQPYQKIGEPMIPLNQNLDIGFGSNNQLLYSAHITDIAPGVWQPVYHHGSAYVLGFSAAGAVLFAAAKQGIANSQESSEFYWNLRYQAARDGALERVQIDALDLHRAMVASNTVRIHTKVLEEPESVRIEAMLVNAQSLLRMHGIELVEESRETFTDTDDEITRFNALAVNETVPTDDQCALFAFRGEAEPDEPVVYFVRTVVPAMNGCAAHPPDQPGVIIASSLANEWTLAHQIGHLLGLPHVEDVDRLMTRRRTDNIEATPPEVTEAELASMLESPLLKV